MDVGGLQRVVHIMIDRLKNRSYDLHLCCLDYGGMFYEKIDQKLVSKYIIGRKPGPFDFKIYKWLQAFIKEKKIDIIHSHNGCSLYAALLKASGNIKGIVHTDHGRLIPDKKSAIWEDRLSSYFIDKVVSVSDPLSEYLHSKVKIKNEKITTIINGVDTEIFIPFNQGKKIQRRKELSIEEDANIIGTVCRLDSIKNLIYLIQIVPEILRINPKCRFVIVGDGPERKYLMEECARMRQNKCVTFMGNIVDVQNVLPIFDIYVNTSLSEGTSMTILEAMSCGLPVIASAVGGNKKLVSESNGVLFNLQNKRKFIESVVYILNDHRLKDEKGKKSREIVERQFSIDRMIMQYEDLYESLIHNAIRVRNEK